MVTKGGSNAGKAGGAASTRAEKAETEKVVVIDLRFIFSNKNGEIVDIELPESMLVAEVKKQLTASPHWPEETCGGATTVGRLRMFCSGKELSDEKSLSDNGVAAHDSHPTAVHVVVLPYSRKENAKRGAAKGTSTPSSCGCRIM